MSSEREREVLRRFLADMAVEEARDRAEHAVGWVTVSVDQENGGLYIRGPYPTPEAALIDAAKDEEEVNRLSDLIEGDPGWKVTVHPLMP